MLEVLQRLAVELGERDLLELVALAERHLDTDELGHRIACLPEDAAARAATAVALLNHWRQCYGDKDRGRLLRRLLGARLAVLN